MNNNHQAITFLIYPFILSSQNNFLYWFTCSAHHYHIYYLIPLQISTMNTTRNYSYSYPLYSNPCYKYSFLLSLLYNQFNTSENHIKKSMLDILTVPPFESIPLIHLLFNLILIDSIPLFIQVYSFLNTNDEQSELTFMLLLWINNENDTYIYLSSYPTPLLSLIDNISTLLNTNMTKENYDCIYIYQ